MATAVMIGVVAANALVTRYYGRSIFHRQILRWGIDLDRPREQRQMAARQVREIMTPGFLAVRPDRTAAELQTIVDRRHLGDVFVVDGDGQRLVGKVPLAILVAADGHRTAGELSEPITLWLEAREDLWSAFLRFEAFVGYAVPVVADAESMQIIGVATESQFISAYRQAIREAREDQGQQRES